MIFISSDLQTLRSMENDESKYVKKYNNWERKIACQEVDKHLRLDTTQISTSANCFIFILVDQGSCEFDFIHSRMGLKAGEIMVFPPTYPPYNIKTSDDYHVLGLKVQRDYAYAHGAVLKIYQRFMSTVVLEQSPVAMPSQEYFSILKETMLLIKKHMERPHQLTDEAISSLYSLFLYDMTVSIKTSNTGKEYSIQHLNQIFIRFLEILNTHFRHHHDIPFYASQLNISPRYLSMIVKKLTGDTVLHYINERIALEACWLLKSTDKSIQQISEELHFSDQASFSKFFKRNRKKNPLQYRRDMDDNTVMR